MADPNDVNKLFEVLHEKKVIDLDCPMRALLHPDQLKALKGVTSPGGEVADSVVAWDGYGLVIKGQVANLEEVKSVADAIRNVGKLNRSGGGL